jgi:hypothetical protein
MLTVRDSHFPPPAATFVIPTSVIGATLTVSRQGELPLARLRQPRFGLRRASFRAARNP